MSNEQLRPASKCTPPQDSLSRPRFAKLEPLSSESAVPALVPGQRGCLRTSSDGTIIEEIIGYAGFEKSGSEVDGRPCKIVLKKDIWLMWTEFNWLDALWPGKLALAARPRGGDLLPKTAPQRRWIDRYAAIQAGAK